MTAIIPISGFTQRNRDIIGMRTHWVEDLRPLSSPSVFVHPPVVWHADPGDILGTVEDVGATKLIIVAYSWGCGYGASRLAKEAIKRGIEVSLITACDGVWRGTSFLGSLLPVFALTCLPKIRFPKEVRRIVGVRQSSGIPAGHRIFLGETEVELTWINTTHNAIDENPKWREISKQAICEAIAENDDES